MLRSFATPAIGNRNIWNEMWRLCSSTEFPWPSCRSSWWHATPTPQSQPARLQVPISSFGSREASGFQFLCLGNRYKKRAAVKNPIDGCMEASTSQVFVKRPLGFVVPVGVGSWLPFSLVLITLLLVSQRNSGDLLVLVTWRRGRTYIRSELPSNDEIWKQLQKGLF